MKIYFRHFFKTSYTFYNLNSILNRIIINKIIELYAKLAKFINNFDLCPRGISQGAKRL